MQSSNTGGSDAGRRHPSFAWDPALRIKPPFVRDPAAFAAAMDNPRYPRAAAWSPEWSFHNSMGPINLWCADALAARMDLRPGMRVLDLGCGAASTSIFFAQEFGVEVWAADLWVSPEDNRRRIVGAGLEGKVHALRAEAHRLPFDKDHFDAVVSIDAYHYFGTEVRYLSYLAQFVRPSGEIGVVVPGNIVDPDDPRAVRLKPPLAERFGADWFTFRSAEWWRRHWSYTACVDLVAAEMLPDGTDDWRRWIAATLAAFGPHDDVDLNRGALESPAGQSLGFCLALARRNDLPGLNFGIGEYEDRIA